MADLRLSLFGGFLMERAGESLKVFESDKARLLLAYLAVENNCPHRRERLAGLFWPEAPESRARHSLSQTLSSLKALFQAQPGDSLLEIIPQEVCFHSENCWLDVREFDDLVQACAAHGHNPDWPCRTCLDRLERAAVLYQGDFLAGFILPGCAAFEEWRLVQQEAYQQQAFQVLGRLSQGFETFGEVEKALVYASRQVALDPLAEVAHRQVMRLLTRQGRRTEALDQFTACQKILADELGVSPEAETVDLYRQILNHPEGSEPVPVQHNLPFPLSSLVGRQAELEDLCLQFADPACRLVTVLGAGGTGKSRLALEAGHHLLPAFPDGVFLVELDTQTSYQSLAPLIARAVGLELQPEVGAFSRLASAGVKEMQGQLVSYLSEKKLLLILDGFECLLHEASQISNLLHRAPQMKVLVTSRARLSLGAEHIFLLEGLDYPETGGFADPLQYSAVQLFVEAARRLDPRFTLTEGNRLAVAEICRLTQGLPLGILLAASWAGMLQPGQILGEIRRSLDFLTGGWQDLPDRQRSLRATFDHSWQLLSEEESVVFLRLALSHAPFTAERAAQVAGASLRDLRMLVDQSLLMPASGVRYRIHDLLRQYVQEKLATLPEENLAAHERHCQVYLQALADWEPRLKCREQPAALAEIDQEYADLLAAWEWAVVDQQWEWLGKAFGALSYYQHLRGLHGMKAELCQKAMDALESQGCRSANRRLWLRLATSQVEALTSQARYAEGSQVTQQIEARLQEWGELAGGMRQEIARFYQIKGYITLTSGGDRLQALESALKGLEFSYAEEDPHALSLALNLAATMHGQVGNVRETGRFAREALAIQQSLSDPFLLAQINSQLGYFFMLSGMYADGIRAAQEQYDHRMRVGGGYNQVYAEGELGLALFYAGQYKEARLHFETAFHECVIPSLAFSRKGYCFFLDLIDLEEGHYQAVLEDAAYGGEPLSEYDRIQADYCRAHVHLLAADEAISAGKACSDPEVASLHAQAQEEWENYLNFHRAIRRLDLLGTCLAPLGYIAYRQSRREDACRYLVEALENGVKQGFFCVFLYSLSSLALILAEAGELEQAVELFATVIAHPCAGSSRWFEDMFGKHLAALTAILPKEIIAAAQTRGRERDLFATGQEYLEKLKASLLLPGSAQ